MRNPLNSLISEHISDIYLYFIYKVSPMVEHLVFVCDEDLTTENNKSDKYMTVQLDSQWPVMLYFSN